MRLNICIKYLLIKIFKLNEENIRLNKINIQMETMIYYYEKNKSYNKIDKDDNNIFENNFNNQLNRNKNNKKIKSNTFFDENKFKDKIRFKNSSSQNQFQKTYLNVGNNITHTNININMMMDYNNNNSSKHLRTEKINKNIEASKELKNNFILEDSKIINENKNPVKNLEKFDFINKNISKYKSYDKIFKYKNIQNKKINNNSYNTLIKEMKNVLICKTLNLSNIKKPRNILEKLKRKILIITKLLRIYLVIPKK